MGWSNIGQVRLDPTQPVLCVCVCVSSVLSLSLSLFSRLNSEIPVLLIMDKKVISQIPSQKIATNLISISEQVVPGIIKHA